MNFVYPYKAEESIKSKLTVSELKRMYQKEEEDLSVPLLEEGSIIEEKELKNATEDTVPMNVSDTEMIEDTEMTEEAAEKGGQSESTGEAYIPDFARKEEVLTGAGRGTIYHKVMEKLVFKTITDSNSLKQQIKEMEKNGFLLPEERSYLNMRKLTAFFTSELGKRMIEADKENRLFKEQPFVIGVPAKEVERGSCSEELVLVQGMIDAYFKEGDELVLMDYKTDRVGKASELAERYKIQLHYYQKALEQITGKKVKEKRIYSFYLGEEITFS